MVDEGSIRCRKWSLFTLTIIALVGQILLLVIVLTTINDVQQPSDLHFDRKTWQEVKDMARVILIVSAVISVLILLMGLVGVFKEHYCLTLAYAILMTLATLGSIYPAIQSPINWLSVLFYLIVTILAYIYAKDINRLRAQRHMVSVCHPCGPVIQGNGTLGPGIPMQQQLPKQIA